jgi:hypothetical protein
MAGPQHATPRPTAAAPNDPRLAGRALWHPTRTLTRRTNSGAHRHPHTYPAPHTYYLPPAPQIAHPTSDATGPAAGARRMRPPARPARCFLRTAVLHTVLSLDAAAPKRPAMLSLPHIPFFALPACGADAPRQGPCSPPGTNPSSLPHCTAPPLAIPCAMHHNAHTHTHMICPSLYLSCAGACRFIHPAPTPLVHPCPPCYVAMHHDTQPPFFLALAPPRVCHALFAVRVCLRPFA